ncbi:hypothetical protein [Halofilum ochraceum]|uniref:hypothetical protein n=1 Tax=Halofilum ochraceum TaxID=1611323 RepID=UPI0008D992D3|nr:hypothetical protein [Halofilum ochraceum]
MCEIRRIKGSSPRGRKAWWHTALAVLALAVAPMPAQAEDEELHDPFMPPGWNEPSAPEANSFNAAAWTLASTLTSNGRRVAIINGRAVRPGEYVGGARLLGVTRGSARLEYNGHRFTIRRPGTQVRTSR